MTELLEEIIKGVMDGMSADVEALVIKALDEQIAEEVILQDGLIAAMKSVGDHFDQGDFFIPEMLVAAKAMQAGLKILKPHLVDKPNLTAGKVVVGTVKGDLHDIGKNLVAMMLEGAGFEVIDLGTDVPPEHFAQVVRESGAQILGLSALLTTTMVNMQATIEALEDFGIRSAVKVLVGGAPVTDEYAVRIGADGYAADASRAANLAKKILTNA